MSTSNTRASNSSRKLIDAELDEIRRKNLTKQWLEQNKIDPNSARNIIPLDVWQNQKHSTDVEEKKKVKTAKEAIHSHHYKPKVEPRREHGIKDVNLSSKSYNAMDEPSHFVQTFPSSSADMLVSTKYNASDHEGASSYSDDILWLSKNSASYDVFSDAQQTNSGVNVKHSVKQSLPDTKVQENLNSTELNNEMTFSMVIKAETTISDENNAPNIIQYDTPFDSIIEKECFSRDANGISQENKKYAESVDFKEKLPTSVEKLKQEESVEQIVNLDMKQDQLSLDIADPEQEVVNQNFSEPLQEHKDVPKSSIIDLPFSFRFFTRRQLSPEDTSSLNPLIQNSLSVINTAINLYNGNVSLHRHPFCSDVQLDSSYASSNPRYKNKSCYLVYVRMSLEILPQIDVTQVKKHVLNSIRVSVTNGVFQNGSRELKQVVLI